MSRALILLLLFILTFIGCANSSFYKPKPILLEHKDKTIFEISIKDLEKIYKAKNLQKKTLEYSIQNALLRQYEFKPLNLNNLGISPLSKKETIKHKVTIWFSYPNLSFITYFNKLTLELEKVKIFSEFKTYDTTSNLNQVLGIKELEVGIYNLSNNKFTTLTKTMTDEYFHRIFYSPKESYIVTILGEPQYTKLKIFDRKTKKLLFTQDYFDKWFFPDVEINFSANEERFSISVGIINNEKKSSFKTYNTKDFKEIPKKEK